MEKEFKIESREQPERNLLNSYEATVEAMAEIEGDAWKNWQEQGGGYTTKGAVEWLKKLGPSDESEENSNAVYTVYGAGGANRWPILRDGTVCFSFHHGQQDVSKAEALGFKIIGK